MRNPDGTIIREDWQAMVEIDTNGWPITHEGMLVAYHTLVRNFHAHAHWTFASDLFQVCGYLATDYLSSALAAPFYSSTFAINMWMKDFFSGQQMEWGWKEHILIDQPGGDRW